MLSGVEIVLHLRALALLQDGTDEVVCNLGTGDGHSVLELIEAAREVSGHAIPARVTPRRPGDPARLVADGSRAGELLGWRAQRSDLRTILSDAWTFHSAHPEGFQDDSPEA